MEKERVALAPRAFASWNGGRSVYVQEQARHLFVSFFFFLLFQFLYPVNCVDVDMNEGAYFLVADTRQSFYTFGGKKEEKKEKKILRVVVQDTSFGP